MNTFWLLFYLVAIPADTTHYPPLTTEGVRAAFGKIPITHEKQLWAVREFDTFDHLSFVLRHEYVHNAVVMKVDSAKHEFYIVQQKLIIDSLDQDRGYEALLIRDLPDSVWIYTPPPPPPPTEPLVISTGENLKSPWIQSSWGNTTTFNVIASFAATRVLKSDLRGWGGLGLHSGVWGSETILDAKTLKSFDFSVYSAKSMKIAVNFCGTSQIPIVAGWNKISVAAKPGYMIKDIWIQNYSSTAATLYFDDIKITR